MLHHLSSLTFLGVFEKNCSFKTKSQQNNYRTNIDGARTFPQIHNNFSRISKFPGFFYFSKNCSKAPIWLLKRVENYDTFFQRVEIREVLKVGNLECFVPLYLAIGYNANSFLIGDDELLKSVNGKDHHQHYINTLLKMLEKQEAYDSEIVLPFPSKGDNEPPKSPLYYYMTISMLLQDKELDETINYMLYEKCCKNDVNFFTSSVCLQSADSLMAEKRNTIKKVKFHSWGGKRSVWPIDKRSSPNVQSNVRANNVDLGRSKIVIRTPFRPWGGR